jgi:hypothetical protein
MNDRFPRLVPSAGQDVAENRPDRGEDMRRRALTNALSAALKETRADASHLSGVNLRHADAQECRAKVAVKV